MIEYGTRKQLCLRHSLLLANVHHQGASLQDEKEQVWGPDVVESGSTLHGVFGDGFAVVVQAAEVVRKPCVAARGLVELVLAYRLELDSPLVLHAPKQLLLRLCWEGPEFAVQVEMQAVVWAPGWSLQQESQQQMLLLMVKLHRQKAWLVILHQGLHVQAKSHRRRARQSHSCLRRMPCGCVRTRIQGLVLRIP